MKYEIKSEENSNPTNNITVLSREPIIALVFLVLFLAVGILFAVLPWGLASNSAKLSLTVKLITSGLGLFCVILIAAVLKGGLSETVIDRSTQMVLFRKRFTGTVTRRISCSNIKDVEILKSKDSEGDNVYQVQLKLIDGDQVPVHRYLTSSKETALYDRERIKFLLQNPYQKFTGKDNTPLISIGRSDISSNRSSGNGSISGLSSGLSDDLNNSSDHYSYTGNNSTRQLIHSGNNWIGVIITVVVLVIVTPFAGWWVASRETPLPQDYIPAGAPTAQLSQQLTVTAADKMEPGEAILYVAKPEPGHEGQVKIWFLPFAIVWTLFSIFWFTAAVAGAISSKSIATWGMALFGVPFVVIGIGMLTTPYITYKRELHTIYALTDKRALVFSNEGVHELVAYDDKHFGPIVPKPYSPERSDIMFRSNLDAESPGVTGGFWGIERSDQALAILNAKWQEKLRNPPKVKGHQRHQHK